MRLLFLVPFILCASAGTTLSADPKPGKTADTTKAVRCVNILYAKARGKSASQLFGLSKSIFSYERAARRAASRNRLVWDTLPSEKRAQYLKRLYQIAQDRVMPRLAATLAEKPIVQRGYTDKGALVIVFRDSSSITVNGSCTILDGKAYGVSLSTLAAEALKEGRN